MKINLVEAELKTAITEFLGNMGIDVRGKDINIELTAGRGQNGHRAEVEILPVVATATPEAQEAVTVPDEAEAAVPPFSFDDEEETESEN